MRRKRPQADEVLGSEAENVTPDDEHSILHHGLKARAMAVDIPTQLVREETLAGAPTVEDDATLDVGPEKAGRLEVE